MAIGLPAGGKRETTGADGLIERPKESADVEEVFSSFEAREDLGTSG
jgi:hypothetical protein